MPLRRAHYLRANHGRALPTLLAVIDTETDALPIAPDATEARLRFGWLATSRRHRGQQWSAPSWYRFTAGAELWTHLGSLIPDGWRAVLLAHNVGFDLRVCDAFRILPSQGWQLVGAVIQDPPTMLRWKRGRQGLLIVDSLNYYRLPLADLGAELGLSKLGSEGKPFAGVSWDDYCRRDVEIVLGAIQTLMAKVRDWDLGNWSPTLASQAFTAWRHRHLSSPILIDANPAALELARRSYHGGRVECFRLGKLPGPVRLYDVVSMYPSVMATEPMPTILQGVYRRLSLPELRRLLASHALVAEVSLATESADYPVSLDGHLIFPVGHFRTVLTSPELRHALERGRIEHVHQVAVYAHAVIFASYVAEWWQRRRDALSRGDRTGAYLAKLMLNSLYGKLGQHGLVWEQVSESDPASVRSWTEVDVDTGTVHSYRMLAGLWQELRGNTESRDSHPAIAAHVTAAARVRLLELAERLGRPYLAYVDTDSLFMLPGAPEPPSDLVAPSTLGMLKLERIAAEVTLYGPKDYTVDGHRKLKGIRANAELIGHNTWRQDLFVGLPGAVQEGDLSRQIIRRVTKVYRRQYLKGDVGADGLVTPYRLGAGADAGTPPDTGSGD